MKPNETVYLQHILDAIAKVETYLQGVDEETFDENSLLQDGVIRQIEIVGEATRHLSAELRGRYPQVRGLTSPVCGTSSFTTTLASTSPRPG